MAPIVWDPRLADPVGWARYGSGVYTADMLAGPMQAARMGLNYGMGGNIRSQMLGGLMQGPAGARIVPPQLGSLFTGQIGPGGILPELGVEARKVNNGPVDQLNLRSNSVMRGPAGPPLPELGVEARKVNNGPVDQLNLRSNSVMRGPAGPPLPELGVEARKILNGPTNPPLGTMMSGPAVPPSIGQQLAQMELPQRTPGATTTLGGLMQGPAGPPLPQTPPPPPPRQLGTLMGGPAGVQAQVGTLFRGPAGPSGLPVAANLPAPPPSAPPAPPLPQRNPGANQPLPQRIPGASIAGAGAGAGAGGGGNIGGGTGGGGTGATGGQSAGGAGQPLPKRVPGATVNVANLPPPPNLPSPPPAAGATQPGRFARTKNMAKGVGEFLALDFGDKYVGDFIANRYGEEAAQPGKAAFSGAKLGLVGSGLMGASAPAVAGPVAFGTGMNQLGYEATKDPMNNMKENGVNVGDLLKTTAISLLTGFNPGAAVGGANTEGPLAALNSLPLIGGMFGSDETNAASETPTATPEQQLTGFMDKANLSPATRNSILKQYQLNLAAVDFLPEDQREAARSQAFTDAIDQVIPASIQEEDQRAFDQQQFEQMRAYQLLAQEVFGPDQARMQANTEMQNAALQSAAQYLPPEYQNWAEMNRQTNYANNLGYQNALQAQIQVLPSYQQYQQIQAIAAQQQQQAVAQALANQGSQVSGSNGSLNDLLTQSISNGGSK